MRFGKLLDTFATTLKAFTIILYMTKKTWRSVNTTDTIKSVALRSILTIPYGASKIAKTRQDPRLQDWTRSRLQVSKKKNQK